MTIGLLIAATILAAPEWRNPPVLSPSDYPTFAVRDKRSVAVTLDILTNPKGKVIKCVPITIAGDKLLAKSLCDTVKIKRVKPAIGANGEAAYGLRREFIKLWLPGTGQADAVERVTQKPDAEFDAAASSGVERDAIDVKLVVEVDQTGKVAGCEFDPAADMAKYAAAACEQLKQADLGTRTDGKTPISYVREVRVRFNRAG